MFVLPLPWVIAEIIIFFSVVRIAGFFNTMLIYFVPCLLGILIVNTVGRMAMMSLQSTVSRGQLPANKLLHSGAVFISGLCFLVPSAFTRIAGVFLLLPGFRHLIVWRFKLYMAKKMASGSARVFNFGGGGPFGFGGFGSMGGMGGGGPQAGGPGGFKYYEFRNDGSGFRDINEEAPQERELTDVEVLDVTPIEITHQEKKKDE
ncbi:FxsA family protein [Bdellovibrio sp. KM01]|uniref:FxsA family protein n=1 Tax=Bdellovibrio sp. KM01 TaxID=2748865 RepID=UPI0015EAE2C9|nr:FxsA family protein [Bdellovibrio sp. KM01]QLY25137.1 FxsA family protein [Bdellovibrio sp. KM01]